MDYVYKNIETGNYYNYEYIIDVKLDRAEIFDEYTFLKNDKQYEKIVFDIRKLRIEKINKIKTNLN